jgi:hypothetical protein
MRNPFHSANPPHTLRAALFIVILSVAPSAAASGKVENSEVIERVEKAIVRASELRESGGLTAGNPYRARITLDFEITFAAETFDGDIDHALRFLGKLQSKVGASSGRTPSPPATDAISSLRDAERSIPDTPPSAPPPTDYSVFEEYRRSREARIRRQDAAAEADMQAVIAERQAAAVEQQMRRERRQQLQAQSMEWQAQLDQGAAESARAAAEWQREHSFGAYARRFLATTIQTGVGAFSSTFFGGIGAELADRAVKGITKSVMRKEMKKAAKPATPSTASPAAGGARASGATAAPGNYRMSGAAKDWGASGPAGTGGPPPGNEGSEYGAGEFTGLPGDVPVPEGGDVGGAYYGSLPPPRY